MSIQHAFKRWASYGLIGFLAPSIAAAATITVDDSGGADFMTIQAAINAASPNDIILISPGTYEEDLIIDKTLTLTASGDRTNTFVFPASSGPGVGEGSQLGSTTWIVRVRADDVLIEDITFNGDNPNLAAGTNARGGIITDFSTGTYSGLEVLNCNVLNCRYRGIYAAAGGTGHSFVGNTVQEVNGDAGANAVGIFFFGAVGEARFNDISQCGTGVGFGGGSGGGLIEGNTMFQGFVGVLANQCDTPVLILDNEITDFRQGLQAVAVDTTVDITDNVLFADKWGLVLLGGGTGSMSCDRNFVDGNFVEDAYGIYASTDIQPFGFGPLTATATRNTFTRCSIGVVLRELLGSNAPVLDIVLSGSAGNNNLFSDNTRSNVVLDDCNDDVDATFNAWGPVAPAAIELTIYHFVDDITLGLVDFSDPVIPADNCFKALSVFEGANAHDSTGALPSGAPASVGTPYFNDVTPDTDCEDFGDPTNLNRDVWYTFEAPVNASFLFSTCNTASYDTKLAIYSGTCDSLVALACNDDADDGSTPAFCAGFSSELRVTGLNEGQTYLLQVGGFGGGDQGTATINISREAGKQNYCTAVANSVSASGSIMGSSGTVQIGMDNLVIEASNMPAEPYLFFFGIDKADFPYFTGFGTVCVFMPTRLTPAMVNAVAGATVTRSVTQAELGNPLPGTSLFFQVFYRDPGFGSAGSTSDGLHVIFAP